VYRNAEGIVIGEKLETFHESFDFFNPSAFGIRFVANSIITTQRLVKENPDLVTKFIEALLRGWREALDTENEARAVETIRSFDRNTTVETIRKQLAATRALVHPQQETPIGKIDREAWRQTEQIMLDQKLIPRPVHVSERLID
jgi:NitT/TauT family transport system substrate-binding protein